MRIRSCQLVYLLLLLCSVQVADARLVGLLASGSIVASTQDARSADLRTGSANVFRQNVRAARNAGPTLQTRIPLHWSQPVDHAASIAVYTSFDRA